MDKKWFGALEGYMIQCMTDSAHDKEHVYRVLYQALDIAGHETGVDCDVLIAACLLHDIGREAQYKNPTVCHAQAGAKMAHDFCIAQGVSPIISRRIAECIQTHRYRSDNPCRTIEAKILFDADKLDVTGTLGIARTLFYKGHVKQPLYSIDDTGDVLDGEKDLAPSFLQEYHFKLKNVYDAFYTARAWQIAKGRRQAAASFYESMLEELFGIYRAGHDALDDVVR